MARISDIPINPEAIERERIHHYPCNSPGDTTLTPTSGVYIRSEGFVAMREIADAICQGTRWNKKARIVVEYDPSQEKMSIMTFMESSELAQEKECNVPTYGSQAFREEKLPTIHAFPNSTVAEAESQERVPYPFLLEADRETKTILITPTEKGPLLLDGKEALALATIIKEQTQSWYEP